jgi:hypothetical protein
MRANLKRQLKQSIMQQPKKEQILQQPAAAPSADLRTKVAEFIGSQGDEYSDEVILLLSL